MKKIRKLNISGKNYEITYNKDTKGSHARTFEQTINIGSNTRKREFDHLLHEVAEVICTERNLLYDSGNRGDLFIMNHGEFTVFTDDLANALEPMIK